MGWSMREYFRKFGHDIEMSERQQKRDLEARLNKYYRTWGSEMCSCYDALVTEAQALARDDEDITALAQKTAIYQMLCGFVEKNVWQRELSVGGIAMSRYIYYPGQVLFRILLRNRDVPCSFQEIEAAMEKGKLLFSETGALTEQVCGTFWQHIMDAIPFYSGDVPPEPEGLDSTFAAAACYGLTENGGRAETLKAAFHHHWQRRSRQQLRDFDEQVSAAREALRRWDTSNPEKTCLLVLLENERERVEQWGPRELDEELEIYQKTSLLYEIGAEDPRRGVAGMRLLLDTAGEALQNPETAAYLLGCEMPALYDDCFPLDRAMKRMQNAVLRELAADDRFARQVFCSAYDGELLESILEGCTRYKKPELREKLRRLLEENPIRRMARQQMSPPIARPAAKEKPEEPKAPVDSGKLYRYCQVQVEGAERTYSYLAEDISVQTGDWVEVPFGWENSLRRGKVLSVETYTAANAPWPPERTKRIRKRLEVLTEDSPS